MNVLRTFLRRVPLAGAALLLFTCAPRIHAAEADDTATVQAAQDLDDAALKQGDTKVSTELTEKFTGLAGSADNATALVTGLRDGSDIKLATTVNGTATTTTFKPATGKLGYGNVFIALALAQSDLKDAGIANPTPAQLEAALNGGAVTVGDKTVALDGVLKLRASGEGWGQIARTLGVRLGSVVSDLHSARERAEKLERGEKGERPEKAARPETPARPHKVDRAITPERPERAARPELPERAQRPGR
jgi:hypothetical protein